MHVHLDAIGGVAGDMFVAALVDARPELATAVREALAQLPLPEGVSAAFIDHGDGILRGRRFVVSCPEPPHSTLASDLGRRIRVGDLEDAVRGRSLAMLDLLAEAESRVHGVAAEKVAFHELGGLDTLVDLVAAAALIEALAAPSWSCGPVPRGRGTVATAHGRLPLPAPAAGVLLEGMVLVDDGVEGERVTPTGAAILRHLGPEQGADPVPRRLVASGHGFGSRTLEGRSNVLRAQLYEPAVGHGAEADQVAVIAFEVDDQTPEDLALGLDRLRATTGVIDVSHHPVVGKAGRVGARVQVLAEPGTLVAVAGSCFAETATIGLRWRIEDRLRLARETTTLDSGGTAVRVKMVERPGGERTAKAELADLAAQPGRAGREAARRQAEARALETGEDDGGGGGKGD
jgi:uncharacterized protein (TIGR00299 family) protein